MIHDDLEVRISLAARPPKVRPLLSGPEEAYAFWRMRRRMLRTVLGQMLREGRLRLTMVFFLSLLLWLGLFWLFHDAFVFLDTAIPTPQLYDRTVQTVFGLFFGTLMVMLVFSSAILLYSSLFRGHDVPLLLTMPARAERVFLTKFQEAIVMSSWAFLLLGSPMLLSYGVVHRAPWYFYAVLAPLLVAFTYVPAGIGAVACLGIVHRVPGGRWWVLVMAGLAVLVGAVVLARSLLAGAEDNLLTVGWFQEMLNRLEITEHRLLPSWWLSTGVLQAARGQWRDAVMFLALMISNALFFRQLAIWTAARLYRAAYSRLHGRRVAKRRTRAAWIDRATLAATRLFPVQVRLLIVKDLRLFRRDPVQWSQFLIFASLLALYFLNIRRFSYDIYYVGWVNAVSFLNVSVVGLLLSTFTTRFVFPMISLEGRRFWFLGLLPVHRDTILWSKFLFAVGCSIIPSSLLILLSDAMLRVQPVVAASHQLTCLVLCFGLSGLAVGLGAKMPSLREESPSRIAAGFGGTLVLVLSTLYIVVVVLLTAVPCHFYFGAQGAARYFDNPGRFHLFLERWLLIGTLGSLVLGSLTTAAPMYLGFRAFRRIEF
ncbi:MAG: hypothetical protein NUV77_05185 [Thermoguttaceae bacterium]|jgi:ABC-2 type transport system permease protein|nr:hypothetical protein [Thermoguttaceae bacterium]